MTSASRNRIGPRLLMCGVGMVMVGVAGAWGQDATEDSDDTGFDWSFAAHTRYDFRADLEGTDNGEYAVWRSGFDGSLGFQVADRTQLEFGLGYEYNNYDFDQPNSFLSTPAAEPFSDIHILDLSVVGSYQVDGQWSWYLGGGIRMAGESGADFGDMTTYSGHGGVGYRFSDSLLMTFGVVASTQIEDDVLILPAITAEWQINDRWHLSATGPGVELRYEIDDETWLGLAGKWENRRFRLDDDVLALSSVIEETQIPVYLHLKRVTGKGLSLDLSAGAIMGREFDIEDRNGRNGRTIDGDMGFFASAGFRYEF